MFKLTVVKWLSDKQAIEIGSSRQMLVDHLVAAATRHGFEVTWDDDDDGELFKQGLPVGGWKIEEV